MVNIPVSSSAAEAMDGDSLTNRGGLTLGSDYADYADLAIWMGGVSTITGFGAALSAVGCTADTFLENEE
jgi:hypothetical protein